MIRNATPADVPDMVAVGALMHAESPRFRGLPWNAAKVTALIEHLVASDDGLALVAEADGRIVGGFLGAVFDHWCTDARSSTDFALFVLPEHRGGLVGPRLLRRYVRWAKGQGVPDALLQCGITTGVDLSASTRLYEITGFDHAGHLFTYGGD